MVSPDWKEQYSRQFATEELDEEGQQRLFEAKVGIFGVGGLGSWSSLMLAQMGVGHFRLVDRDVVELSNLPRTPIYTLSSVDLPKVEEAEKFLRRINPNATFEGLATNIDVDNIEALVQGLDIVVDGLDHFSTRYLINQACLKYKVPYVFAGGLGTTANLSTFTYRSAGKHPCLACFFGGVDDNALPTCETSGVLATLLAVATSLQVAEVVRVLTGSEPLLEGKIAYFDLRSFSLDLFPVKTNPSCPICQQPQQNNQEHSKPRISELCGSESFIVSPKPRRAVNIAKLGETIEETFEVGKKGSLGLTLVVDGATVSVFNSGTILIRGVGTKDKAEQIYSTIRDTIEQALV